MSATALRRLTAVLLLTAARPAVAAQTLVLQNGDRLTGTLLRMSDKRLQFSTTYAGTIGIDWNTIKEIRSDEPMNIRLTGNGTIPVRVLTREGENFRLDDRNEPAVNVTQINPDDWETGKASRLNGEINLSLKLDRGNTHENRSYIATNLEWKKLKHRMRFSGELEYDKTDTIEALNRWVFDTSYDNHFSNSIYYGATTSFKKDGIAALDLRWNVGPYAGWSLIDTPVTKLSAETGLNYTTENYQSRQTATFLSDAWRMDFSTFIIPGKLEIYHRNKGLISLSSNGGLSFDTWTGIKLPISGGLQTSAEIKTGYNSEAQAGKQAWDTTWRMKLGYRW